jgi:hypothetical protein
LTLLLSSSSAQAQTGAFAVSGQAISPFGAPQANARITFCPYTATGVPCSPQATIYADPLLSIPLTQPYATDQFGNYNFWAPSGTSYLLQIAVNPTTTYSYYVTAGGGGGSGGGTVTSISWSPVVDLPVSPTTITTAGTFVQTYLHTPTGTTDAVNPAGYHVFVFNNEPNLYYPIIKATNSSAPATDQIGFDQFSSVPAIQYVSGSGLLFTTGPANSDNVCFRGYGSQYNFNTSCIGPELGGSQFAQTWNDIGSPGKLEVALVPQSLGNPAIAPTQILWLNNFTTTSTTATAVSCSGTVATITDTQSYAGGQWLYFAAGFSPSSLVGMQQVLTGPTGSSFQINSSCGGTGTGGTINTATAEAAGNYIATGALDQTFHFGFSGSDFGTWNSTNLSVLGTGPGTIGVYDSSGSNALTLTVPSSVTPYTLTLPGLHATSGNTYLSCTAANPSVCSWGAGGSVSGTIGEPMIGTGSSIASQPQSIDAHSQGTTNLSTDVQAAFTQLSNEQVFVDARAYAPGTTQAATVNMYANLTYNEVAAQLQYGCLLTNFSASGSAQTVIGNDIVTKGCGQGGDSVWTATGSFPASTPLVTVGDNTHLVYGTRFEDLRLSCGSIATCTVFTGNLLNEFSGLNRVAMYGSNNASPTGPVAKCAGCAHSTWDNIEANASGAGVDGFDLSGAQNVGARIERMTCSDTSEQTGNACIYPQTTTNLSYQTTNDIHMEGYDYAIQVGAQNADVFEEVDTTGSTTTDTLHVNSGGAYVGMGLFDASSSSPNILNDLGALGGTSTRAITHANVPFGNQAAMGFVTNLPSLFGGVGYSASARSSAHTASVYEHYIQASGTTTITIPVAPAFFDWTVTDTSGATTLACASGNFNGVSSITISAGQVVAGIHSDGTNCFGSISSSDVIADIQITLPTSTINANTCTSYSTATMTGVTTTTTFSFSPASDPTGVTGWGSVGGLVIASYPTTNTLNWAVCNQSTSNITPGSLTANVSAR